MELKEKEYKLSRAEKRIIAHRGELRCEACNRFHEVDEDAYQFIIDNGKEYVYLCPRARCKKSRAENLIDENLISVPNTSYSGKMYHPVVDEKNLWVFKMYD